MTGGCGKSSLGGCGEDRRDLLATIEDRHGVRSTIVTCQLSVQSGMRWSATGPSPMPSSEDNPCERSVDRRPKLITVAHNLKPASLRCDR